MKTNKAILIDPLAHSVSVIDCGDFRDIQKHLKCDCFTTVQLDDKGNTLFVDDMGWVTYSSQVETIHKIGAFKWEGYGSPLAGRGLILGTNLSTGDSVDCGLTVEEVTEKVAIARLAPHLVEMLNSEPDIVT